MCWCLSIIELKNARWNIEIYIKLVSLFEYVLLSIYMETSFLDCTVLKRLV